MTYPKGIVQNVMVKVEHFVVLDMPEDKNIPLILGRPVLATDQSLINVQDGGLTFCMGDETITFSIYDALRRPIGRRSGK